MDEFANLALRASQASGAPVHLARHLGIDPYHVYRWIAGVEELGVADREHFEIRLRAVLYEKVAIRAQAPAERKARRWSDRRQGVTFARGWRFFFGGAAL
jgi:hypothetical protein